MRGKRSKWLSKQVKNGNPAMLVSLRNAIGKKTETIKSEMHMYDLVKKLWNRIDEKERNEWKQQSI